MAKLPKLQYVKFTRAKGKLYAYFNTGQRVNGKPVFVALPPFGSVGFYDTYATMMGHRKRAEVLVYTVADVADAFERSPEFRQLAPNTQDLYIKTLRRVCEHLGKFPVDAVERRHVREIVENRLSGNGARNIFIALVGILYAYARRSDLTMKEPTKDVRFYRIGQWEPWPEEVLQAALVAEHDRTRLAANLLYYTGQRIGDVVRMRWVDIDRDAILVVQQKTKKVLRIPLHADLRAVLSETPKAGETIIVNWQSKAMRPDVIRRELKQFAAGFGLQLVPHGLRKNAVNALLEAGATVPEVAAITGQTFNVIQHYAKRVNQQTLSESAMAKLENKGGKFKPGRKLAEKDRDHAKV